MELDNASFSSFNRDDGLTSLQWLLRPLPCDFSVPGADGRGYQPGPAHHRQPVSSSEVPLSRLAADPAAIWKPPYTYPMMICMAMQDSGKSNITVSCICEWFVENFSYFRHHANPDSWKNSVWHNLSTVKGFIGVSQPEDNAGKGGFWTVALNKWMTAVKNDPTLQRPPAWSQPLQSVEQNRPGKEIGRLKRKKHPDSTASVAKVPRRSSSLRLNAEERKELDGLLVWVLSRELSLDHPLPPVQQHQDPELCSVATSAVSSFPSELCLGLAPTESVRSPSARWFCPH